MSEQMIINESEIQAILADGVVNKNTNQIREILIKAQELHGLDLREVAQLMAVQGEELLREIFITANKVKEEIYGRRLVIFAPLYVSNFCTNECLYCAFRAANKTLKRRFLVPEEIERETEVLINQGHKRILLLAGEAYPQNNFQYILDAIKTVYNVKNNSGEIRRVNVNLAALDLDDFKRLKDAEIGTYQLFQETYHCDTYGRVHLAGKKANYDWHLTAFDRAMQAGIDDVGFGALFGLYDWRFEVLALLQHANYLQDRFGVGPHTISVPRLEPAFGSEIASNPPVPVTDLDFCKIVAILRLAIPYTGIIMSTRETPQIRQQTFALGVSQISAGSRTDPGGYSDNNAADSSQFFVSDHRSLDEIIRSIIDLGYSPSFCTACYRRGRTGEDFMCLAKPGKIKNMCAPNAVATFAEYLSDNATPETKIIGDKFIKSELVGMLDEQRHLAEKLLDRIKSGERDVCI